jgi:hypothetical protein
MPDIPIPQGAPIPTGYGFLPKGDVFKTARCRRLTHAVGDTLYVVVHPTSRSTTLGLLAPTYILDEVDIAEEETREARARAITQRDAQAAAQFRAALLEQFPHVPDKDADKVLTHALVKHSGRVGRTGTLDLERKVKLAVEAHIRHAHTRYEGLLREGEERDVARDAVWGDLRAVSAQWAGKSVEEMETKEGGRKGRRGARARVAKEEESTEGDARVSRGSGRRRGGGSKQASSRRGGKQDVEGSSRGIKRAPGSSLASRAGVPAKSDGPTASRTVTTTTVSKPAKPRVSKSTSTAPRPTTSPPTKHTIKPASAPARKKTPTTNTPKPARGRPKATSGNGRRPDKAKSAATAASAQKQTLSAKKHASKVGKRRGRGG